MKRVCFALVGAASLALTACGGQQEDTPDEAATNVETEQLNMLAENAAMEAESEALGNATDELEESTETVAPPVDENVTDPSVVEEDVQGM